LWRGAARVRGLIVLLSKEIKKVILSDKIIVDVIYICATILRNVIRR